MTHAVRSYFEVIDTDESVGMLIDCHADEEDHDFVFWISEDKNDLNSKSGVYLTDAEAKGLIKFLKENLVKKS